MFTVDTQKLAEWKKKFGEGNVFSIEVEGKMCIVHKPSRKDLSFAMTMQKDPIKYGEALLNACWIDGDSEIKSDDELFLAAVAQLNDLTEIKKAEIKKL